MALLLTLADVGFGVWGAWGKTWYWYPLNIAILFGASSIYCTVFLQSAFKCFFLAIFGRPGHAFRLALLCVVLCAIPYGLSRIVFASHLQIALFLGLCTFASIIEGITSGTYLKEKHYALGCVMTHGSLW